MVTEKSVNVLSIDGVNTRYDWPKVGGSGGEKVGILRSSPGESNHTA